MTATRWLPAYVALAFVWGNSFLFIKVAVASLHPVQVTLGRMVLGAATLLLALALTRQRLPRDLPLWGHFAVVSVLLTTLPFTLFAYGEQHVSSVLAAIWNATTPLCTLLFTLLLLREERPTRSAILGLAVGFVGVLVVLGVWRPMPGGALAGSAACFAAAASYGIGGVYMRRFVSGRPEPAVVLAAGQLAVGTVQVALLSVLLGVPPMPLDAPPRVWLSLVGLGAFGTGIAYLLLYRVIRVAGLTTVSSVTYLLPLVAAASGLLLLDERLSWNQPAGAVIVLVAIALVQGVLRVPRRSAPVRV
ncbi:MAG: DMT family transporter [Actinomycetota bacterium]|nr:DMT family transporter [Actinomycetota bacterium]